MPFRAVVISLRAILALCIFMVSDFAHAELMDRIDIERHGNEVEISIRLNAVVQYLRHAPVNFGKSLRIYSRLTSPADEVLSIESTPRPGTGTAPGQPRVTENVTDILKLESMRPPDTDMVPRFTVTYPEIDNSFLVEFDRPTRFTVRPGADGRSISILVPLLPGAKDWFAQVNAEPRKPATEPVVLPTPAVTQSLPAVPESQPVPTPPHPLPKTPAAAETSAPSAPTPEVPLALEAQSAPPPPAPVVAPRTAATVPSTPPPGMQATTSSSEPAPTTSTPRPDAGTAQVMPGSTPLAIDETEARAQELMDEARQALAARQGAMAAQRLTQVLSFPENSQTETAQALMGEAREYSGELNSARGEFELYLKLYPNGIHTAQIKEKLTSLETSPARITPATTPSSSTVSIATAPLPDPATATTQVVPKTTPRSKDEVETQAKEWMDGARQAIAARRGVTAAQRLNEVLSLPTNSETENAQALMGEAREYSGETSKARAEYELYLKLYPNGSHTALVKEKLASLDQSSNRASPGLGLKPTSEPATWTTFGSISQYMYYGQSQIENITPPPPGQLVFNRDTLSLTDQKSLISNVDLQARRRDGITDTRIVFRDTDNRNFLDDSRSYNRVYTGYVEQTHKQIGYFFRAGRQVGTGNGVMSRFDGLLAGYNLNPAWRVNVVAGTPVEFGSEFQRSLYGASVDYAPELGKAGFSLYYNEQTLEGTKDRQAIGTELRYFDSRVTAFGMFDYDINYRELNIAMLQANLRADDRTNYFANIDIRKVPPLSLLTALPGQISLDPFEPTRDFRSLFFLALSNLGLDELRKQAAILTADSQFFSLGFTHQVTPRWQLGADYRQANISGVGASGILPAQPGSGTNHVVSGQALGNGLWMLNDSTVINANLIRGSNYTGQAYNLTYAVPYGPWRFDGLLRFYFQKDDQDQQQKRFGPTFKMVYRWRDKISLEAEIGAEIFDETGPLRELHTRRQYFFAGYRWDLQ
ncbi:MAG: hypothetical protein EHM16_09315 [Betaproteobacteria bacterium]|nr:MAG: hypothetical protein EHM16_09315 [Betaproteobacteria bacterium]